MTIATRRMHHLSFATPDLAASLAFWRDALGFSEIARPPLDFDGAWLSRDGLEIHLIVPKDGFERAVPAARPNPYLSHVAFQVADVDAVRAELGRLGWETIEQSGGVRQLWVLDPGGTMVEFIQV